jgi:hypothetical protein
MESRKLKTRAKSQEPKAHSRTLVPYKSIWTMPASRPAAITPLQKIFRREDPIAFFQVIVFAFDQLW